MAHGKRERKLAQRLVKVKKQRSDWIVTEGNCVVKRFIVKEKKISRNNSISWMEEVEGLLACVDDVAAGAF